MSPAEAQVLLSMASAFDNRKPDSDAAKAWSVALDDLRFEDCRLALIDHYRTSTEWLMPAMVRTAVRRMRAKRIADAPQPTPPPGLTPLETNAWLKDARRRIGDGEVVETAGYGELEQRHLPELRALIQRGPARDAEAESTS